MNEGISKPILHKYVKNLKGTRKKKINEQK